MIMVRDIWGKRLLLKPQDIKLVRDYNLHKYTLCAQMSREDAKRCKSIIELIYGDVLYLSTTFEQVLELFGVKCEEETKEENNENLLTLS